MRKFSGLFAVCLLMTTVLVAGETKKGDFVSLSDGKTFDGWKASENKDSWSIKDGAFVCAGPRSHLFYTGKLAPFKNFEFQVECMTTPGSNGGVYFHTKYQEEGWPTAGFEAQVNNSHGDPKRTGSLYAVVNVTEAPAKDNEWFTMNIRVEGKKVTIKVDGKTLVEYTEPEDAKPQSKQFARILGSGTFAFQAHDPKSVVYFKNPKVKKLP